MPKEKSFNLQIIDVENKLLQVIQESKLPATVMLMILEKTVSMARQQTQQIVEKEKQDFENANKTNKENFNKEKEEK